LRLVRGKDLAVAGIDQDPGTSRGLRRRVSPKGGRRRERGQRQRDEPDGR
jgi:hypothetical protein